MLSNLSSCLSVSENYKSSSPLFYPSYPPLPKNFDILNCLPLFKDKVAGLLLMCISVGKLLSRALHIIDKRLQLSRFLYYT
jgi:hypothetical protein